MLCDACRRQVPRRRGVLSELRRPAARGRERCTSSCSRDGSRVPIVRAALDRPGPGQLDRARGSVGLARARAHHALRRTGAPLLQDLGSSAGTWVDGHRLDEPQALRRRRADQARRRGADGRAAAVRPQRRAGRCSSRRARRSSSPRPDEPDGRLDGERSATGRVCAPGYALKRLEAAEGTRRWVLKDLVGGRLAQLTEPDVRLLELLDGRHTIPELVGESERLLGSAGPARLARLLADLAARGLLAGSLRRRPRSRSREACSARAGSRSRGAGRDLRARLLARRLAPLHQTGPGDACADRARRPGRVRISRRRALRHARSWSRTSSRSAGSCSSSGGSRSRRCTRPRTA